MPTKPIKHPLGFDNAAALMPAHPNKDEKSRIGFYLDWLEQHQLAWYQPDLAAYRDYLLYHRTRPVRPGSQEHRPARLKPSAAVVHLATIRARYDALLRDNQVRQFFYDNAPYDSPADRKAFVDEILARIQNAVHPSTAPVRQVERQDVADSEYLRLKPHQVRALLRAPGIESLRGIRDTAMIALLVCTGIREAELCALDIDDLRQSLNEEPSLRIREGKGSKQRLIPYGPLDWCLIYVDAWLEAAPVTTGKVFRGFYRGNRRVRPTGITTRSVNRIMNNYPILIDGELRTVKPHDLRRTYARNAYEFGLDLEQIRQNLGHTGLQTTQNYIGDLTAGQRRPPDMFSPPHDLQTLKSMQVIP